MIVQTARTQRNRSRPARPDTCPPPPPPPPAHLRRLVLTGFMGAGKSTVGRLLAARLGWEFLDLDAFIESRTGLSRPLHLRHPRRSTLPPA